MLAKQLFAQFLALFGEDDRLCLAHGIEDHSFFVQSSESIPVVSFPCASGVVESEKEQRQHHLIDLVFVVVHDSMLPLSETIFNGLHRPRTPNHALHLTPVGVVSSAFAGRVTGPAWLSSPILGRSA